ncbi:MAG: GIY-YIG nuclease family protein, partial [Ignavibacteriaceae bacterium]|nr:GIY-YIG nuclease family protein [Ignavibacteriaceae bacterium]
MPVRVRPSVLIAYLPMFIVYVIKSISRNYIYVGMTNNLTRRLRD